uniref:Putative 3-phosphoserine phosphatase n=1 Tax=Tuber borchii TaxID=42251 RepID=Q8J0H4_TUBBO|nr:putative 3-phosphoserine phosphatase [Tuber borchii]
MAPAHKAIVFTDFDGTITLKDSNDYLTDNIGYGPEKRREGNIDILENRVKFRDAFKEMLDSVKKPFPECIEILRKNIKLDPGFKDFYDWCLSEKIPVIVLSSGMEPIIRALLTDLVGPHADQIKIVSNQPKFLDPEGNEWTVEYHDDSDFGHDKSLAIKPTGNLPKEDRPVLFYCGDGVSDLSAARETDLLFAKYGHDLITYCEREGAPFTVFKTFEDIHRDIKDIMENKTTIDEVASRHLRAKDAAKAAE